MAEFEQIPKVGDVINDHYKLIRKISNGDHRVIFCAIDIKMHQIALKLEKEVDGETEVCIESAILKILNTKSDHVPKFYQYGSYKVYKFLAQELLGPNMIDLVNYKKPYKFSLHSVLKFSIQAIEILQIIHNQDFVHRDIKPNNFLIGNTQETTGKFYLTGFGLCKKLNRKDGVIIKSANKGKFRGSMAYASLNAHHHIEMGRHDDLTSLLYILVEFYNGMLPWSYLDDAEQIQQLKNHYHGQKLLKHLPKQFLKFESHISSLDYQTDPNYALLISLMKETAHENKIDLDAPFEWEEEINEERCIITSNHVNGAIKKKYDLTNSEQELQEVQDQMKTSTVQEFLDVLETLTGVQQDTSDDSSLSNNQYESQQSIRQDNYVEQFIDGMKKNDDKYKQLDWAAFVEQTGGSHQKEGFDDFEIGDRETSLSDRTS
ncbi:MAG: putative Tau-tubulin kinase 1 [Streblomastix strix]|uniref:non-specific serine/threonine protein kinase n=1 Tax=Streblomastix strix TaxID=222440 RepID=A0A5J4X8Z4_9EUKA|nr:MAG: putative Tau-tubulin kinase 1 [Streblomastix strix]